MGQGASSSACAPCAGAGLGVGRAGDDLTLALPDECLASVFAKLGCHDRNACSLVCRRWRVIDAGARHRLALGACVGLAPALPSLLARFSSVSALSLKCSRKAVSVDNAALSLIASSLPALSRLKIKGCVDLSDDGLVALSVLRQSLSKLSLASCSFSAPGLNSLLASCPRLLDLSLKRLRKLDAQSSPLLFSPPPIADKSSGRIGTGGGSAGGSHEATLERLCLKDLHNARLFAPLLGSAKRLRTLIVCRSSGPWDQVLANLPVSIVEIQVENVQLSDTGLAAIASTCRDLEVLYVSRVSDCSDAGFSSIAASCRKLRKIHIDAGGKFGGARNVVGDVGVAAMANKCSHLQEVVLMAVPLTVLALDALAGNCPVLERMALCNSESIGDSELGFVAAKFTALKKLCIKNCPVSDPGVEALAAGCPNLVKLKVKRCRGVTSASVGRLRADRRSLVISVDPGALSFDEAEEIVAEDEDAGVVTAAGRGRSHRHQRGPSTVATAHVVCGSKSAGLIRSKLMRKSSAPSSSSSSRQR